ncbi:MAG: hypothetical protein KC736_03370 [Candidatus Moranbacteria bacterium]|nr:hypothetical protein [Candidatus Moranbacteria bacterium]
MVFFSNVEGVVQKEGGDIEGVEVVQEISYQGYEEEIKKLKRQRPVQVDIFI